MKGGGAADAAPRGDFSREAGRTVAIEDAVGLVEGPAIARPRPDADVYTRSGALFTGADVPDSVRDAARRRWLAVADVVAILAAYGCVWLLNPPPVDLLTRWPLLAALPGWVLLNKLMGLYDRDDKVVHKSTLDELPRILNSVTLGSLLAFMLFPVFSDIETLRGQTMVFWLSLMGLMPALRATARFWVRERHGKERCLIVGRPAMSALIARKLDQHPEYATHVVGFVDEAEDAVVAEHGVLPKLGGVEDFAAVCERHAVERVLVGFSSISHEQLLDIIRQAKRARIKISIVPRLSEVIGHNAVVDEIEGMTVLSLRGLTRSRSSLLLKRGIDVAGALGGLVVLSPLLLAIAAAVKLTSRGPVLYRQERAGRDGRRFRMLKFRTMVANADQLKPALLHLNEADGIMFKISDDPRITRLGRVLRRTSIDELPQLVNVLRGEMSLVGPRPLVPAEADHVIGWHRARLDLKPGLTGPWQVLGRTAIPFHEMVKIDYLYVAEWSLWNDVRLLLRTLPVVVFARGA